jgi:CDP-diacylglycerol--serine O-phosphatidyltransferase
MDLGQAKYLLPNSLTFASVFAGFHSIHLSLTATSTSEMSLAAWLLVVAMACDALDGRVARMTKTESDLGVQLDSLADSISFGIAPAFLMYAWGLKTWGFLGMLFAFFFAACAILRLARYNLLASEHEGVMKYFYGLPTPLAAGAVVSVVMAHLAVTQNLVARSTMSVAAMSTLLGVLMISQIRYRTFKDVNFRGRAGVNLLVLVGGSACIGAIFRPSVAFVVLMFIYIFLGLGGGFFRWSRALLGDETDAFEFDDEIISEIHEDRL